MSQSVAGARPIPREPMRAVLVFPPKAGEVEVHARQAATAFEFLDPLSHRGHQFAVERMNGCSVRGGRNAEPQGRAGGKAVLAVVIWMERSRSQG